MANKILTNYDIKHFNLNGHLLIKNLINKKEINILAKQCDLISNYKAKHIPLSCIQMEPGYEYSKDVKKQLSRKLFNLAVYDKIFWNHVINEKILSIIVQLFKTKDVKLYGDQLFMKPPIIGSGIDWHQDSASWCDIFPMDLITAWTAIDESTIDNGCLQFIPGTHRMGVIGREGEDRIKRIKKFLPFINSKNYPIIKVPMAIGSVHFHHSLIIHSSSQNISNKRRRGYAVHYMRSKSWKDSSVNCAPKMPNFKIVCGKSYKGYV